MASSEKHDCVKHGSRVEMGLREGGGKRDYLKEKVV